MLGLWEQKLWIQARAIVWRGPAVDERNLDSVMWTWAGKSSWLGAFRGGTRWGVGPLRDFYFSLQLPNYKNFKGTIQELGQNQYAVSGEIFVVDRNTVEITELPVRTWTQVGTRCKLPEEGGCIRQRVLVWMGCHLCLPWVYRVFKHSCMHFWHILVNIQIVIKMFFNLSKCRMTEANFSKDCYLVYTEMSSIWNE